MSILENARNKHLVPWDKDLIIKNCPNEDIYVIPIEEQIRLQRADTVLLDEE